jgi:hypothetical protein
MGPPSERARYVPTAFNVGDGCLTLMAVTTNTWLPQTTGELQLRPGTSSCHAMFSVALHVSGSRASSAATPARLPLNCGQFCAADGITEMIANNNVRRTGMVFAILA